MRHFFVLITVAVMVCGALPVEAQHVDEGYVFTSELQSHSRRTLKSRVMSTILPMRVAVDIGDNRLSFPWTEAVEYIETGSGSFYKYYPPAQEDVNAEYISVAQFNKATRKVSISREAPAGWETGKRYTFNSLDTSSYLESFTLRTVRIAGDMMLATEPGENFELKNFINITGATLVEIELANKYATTIYFYNGQQVIPAGNITGNEYRDLVVDDNGNVFSNDSETNSIRRETRLSYVFGMYPDIDYFGWISPTEVVVDNMLCVAE